MLVPGIERVEAQHVERFVAEVGLHDFGDVAVVAEGHVHVFEAAVGLVDAVERLILGHELIGVFCEVLGEDDVGGPGAADGEGVSDDAPLWFAVETKTLAEVVEMKLGEDHPARLTVTTHGFGGLQEMLDLREVGVGVAVVDEGVEELGCLPDGLLALAQAEVLGLFGEGRSRRSYCWWFWR